jgi:transposase
MEVDMGTQKRRRYDAEFKREAVRLQQTSGKSCLQIEKELGISPGILKRWNREYATDAQHSFRGNGKMHPDDAAFSRLQRELDRVRKERDILKKAVAIFSKDPNRYLDS